MTIWALLKKESLPGSICYRRGFCRNRQSQTMFSSESYLPSQKNAYFWRNSILIERCIEKETLPLQRAAGEIAGSKESVFCFIRVTEIANFRGKDRDNVTLILYLYRLRIRMCRIPYHYTYRRENIVSSFISSRRLAMPGDWWTAGQVSRFFCIYKCLFWGLAAEIQCIVWNN